MNVAETALRAKDTGVAGQLCMAIELSGKKWLLARSDGARGPSRYTVDALEQLRQERDCACRSDRLAVGVALLAGGARWRA